jgi:hypothetical protein
MPLEPAILKPNRASIISWLGRSLIHERGTHWY